MKILTLFDIEKRKETLKLLENNNNDSFEESIKKSFIFSSCNINYLVLMIKFEYVIIEYLQENLRDYYCANEIDLAEFIVKEVYKQKKIKKKEVNTTTRSNQLSKNHKIDYANEKFFTKKYIEVNYLYSNATRKEYSINSEVIFPDFIYGTKELRNEYLATIEKIEKTDYIEERRKEEIIEKIWQIYTCNNETFYQDFDRVVFSSIEQIINHLNKKQ
jgi:hypothetical protein